LIRSIKNLATFTATCLNVVCLNDSENDYG
jgi:hypothetical protein